ncbi:MAG: site-specific integrase [Candidatus Thiodiazotropha taylori]|nr:site-specific integrase [Candidatus Thiodiazotropha taylori]MCG8112263.1 site-specific integrase [Candidatus Thiodiazotropha taylori]MCW4284621.1 site-specific integrase [Candidatus Thiodiazotropha taylori]MCW4345696.1 site-specific integrase [Candidatus Thiodiazotropha endolucinida]
MNTAKSAISSFLSIADPNRAHFGSHVLIKRFMKGIFEIKPSLPRYNCTWSIEKVLKFLKSLAPLTKLSLLQLSRKLVTLLALSTGQRAQTLHMLDIRNIESCETHLKLRIGDLLKTSKPNSHLPELFISQYIVDLDLCVVRTYLFYVEKTVNLRQDSRLFIKTQKPYSWVSRQTLSHWIKDTLKQAGIDMSCFSPHSTRSASCSAAASSNVPIDTILRTAGWKRDNVFRKFYNRPVSNDDSFSRTILSKAGDN